MSEATKSDNQNPLAFNILAKPIGPVCNLACKYCYYLEKESLYGDQRTFRMQDDVLETYIRQYIEAQDVPSVQFGWQGGEPTLLGLDYFRKIVKLQQQYAQGKEIHNAIQTNGTRLDDEWCTFLTDNRFLVGLSVDGPAQFHNYFRQDKHGQPSHDQVMHAVELLLKHKTEFNTLTVVNHLNADHPRRVYRFLKGLGTKFFQFIPIVERLPDDEAAELGLAHDIAPAPGEEDRAAVTSWTVRPEQFGTFLCLIFDEWVRCDVGEYFVQIFDSSLSAWMGYRAPTCTFSETCGQALVIEHNGDLYACDHYVYPRYRLGNIMEKSMIDMVNSPQQTKFGRDKRDALPKYCMRCDVRFICNGECPKHRFSRTPDGEKGLNYLCSAYKKFFHHIDPYMREMAHLVHSGQPAALIMESLKRLPPKTTKTKVKRNDSCPCGSGKKYKHCCGASS